MFFKEEIIIINRGNWVCQSSRINLRLETRLGY